MTKVLVIGYGNPLRSDDRLGWQAAQRLEALLQSQTQVEVCACQQLTPELAGKLCAVELAIFIDASIDQPPGVLNCAAVQPDENLPAQFSHDFTPAKLLAFTELLYASTPQAFLVSIGAETFALGETLSPAVKAALPDLLTRVENLVISALEKAAPAL
jgi:hydrogenase maturation protease